MSVFRPLIGKCECGNDNRVDWTKCTCPRSKFYTANFEVAGKQYQRVTGMTTAEDAERWERNFRKNLEGERKEEVWAFFEQQKRRRTLSTIGDVEKAYLAKGTKVTKTDKQAARNIGDLYRVVGYAKGLMISGDGKSGYRPGQMAPDKGRIKHLSASVLTKELIRDYFAARCEGVVNWQEAQEGYRSINSTLGHARDVFRGKGCLKLDGLQLPDLAGFLKHPLLPQESDEPEPLSHAQVVAMLEAWDKLPADSEMGLINEIFREVGLRSGSLAVLRKDWLRELQDGWWMDVKERKGGTRLYSAPISESLAKRMLKAAGDDDFVICPKGTPAERAEAVNGHNAWLKGVLGLESAGQGNHRMRDTLATALLRTLGVDVASWALGHENPKTTLKHYARCVEDFPARYLEELRAWERVKPKNVVVMPAKDSKATAAAESADGAKAKESA